MKKFTKILLATIIGLAFTFSSYGQETVYCIAGINANPSPVQSYGVAGNSLTYQATGYVTRYGYGPVGLAMDEASGVLFVCYESSSTIMMLNASNMSVIGSTTAPGAGTVSGIAYDPTTSKLYANNRASNIFYKFTWDPVLQTLTNDYPAPGYINLPGVTSIWDIALDHVNGILYCGDNGYNAIRYYSTSDFTTLAGSYTVGLQPVGVDLDLTNQILYSTDGMSGYQVSQYTIGVGETNLWTTGGVTLGVAANQSTGYVYLTTYNGGSLPDRLLVMDPSNGAITWNSGDIGDPSAVLYTGQGFNPLGLTVTPIATCFNIGQNLTYNIAFNNGNPTPVTGVIVTDTLPANVSFVSATGSPTVVGNVVTWNVGTLAPATGGSFQLTCTVNSGTVVDDVATIRSNETAVVIVNQQSIECAVPPNVPLSDWAIYIAIFLIGIAIWFRFKTRIA